MQYEIKGIPMPVVICTLENGKQIIPRIKRGDTQKFYTHY